MPPSQGAGHDTLWPQAHGMGQGTGGHCPRGHRSHTGLCQSAGANVGNGQATGAQAAGRARRRRDMGGVALHVPVIHRVHGGSRRPATTGRHWRPHAGLPCRRTHQSRGSGRDNSRDRCDDSSSSCARRDSGIGHQGCVRAGAPTAPHGQHDVCKRPGLGSRCQLWGILRPTQYRVWAANSVGGGKGGGGQAGRGHPHP